MSSKDGLEKLVGAVQRISNMESDEREFKEIKGKAVEITNIEAKIKSVAYSGPLTITQILDMHSNEKFTLTLHDGRTIECRMGMRVNDGPSNDGFSTRKIEVSDVTEAQVKKALIVEFIGDSTGERTYSYLEKDSAES